MTLNNSDLHTYAREQARTMQARSFYITTNGCEEGSLESARVKLFLENHGLCYTNDINNADIIIFYACGLTNESENKSLKDIDKLMTLKNPSAELIVWGCLPKINYDAVKNICKNSIIGPRDINYFENLVKTNRRIQTIDSNFLFPHVKNRSFFSSISSYQYHLYESAYYIKVSRGCMGHCTYCSDRLAHGRMKSEPIQKIVSQFKQGLEKGYTNFYLVGRDLGSYGLDIDNNLPDLLNSFIDAASGKNYNLLLPNICPNFLLEYFSDLQPIFSTGKVIEIGCEVQSGSDRILKLMGRMYTSKEWEMMMRYLDNRYPKIYLQTHLLIGFPTESDEDFKETLKLLDNVSLDRITLFKYSDRPGTRSLKIGGKVPENIKKYRYWRLFLKSRINIVSKRIKRKIIKRYRA